MLSVHRVVDPFHFGKPFLKALLLVDLRIDASAREQFLHASFDLVVELFDIKVGNHR
jgi:hypothetical protein